VTDRPLRILMLAPTPFFADRGCHVRIYEEARALRQRGHDVRLVTYHLGRDMADIPAWRIPAVPWYRKLAAGPSWHKPYLDLLLLWTAWRACRSFRPHLLHAHLHEGAFVGLILRRLLGLPLLFDYQGSLTGEMGDHGFLRPASPLGRCFRWLEEFLNRSPDMIITSSGAAAVELVDRWQLPPERVTPLIDGVDIGQFRPMDGAEVRRRFGIADHERLVVYLGVLNRYQGVHLLLQAAQRLQARDIRFLVMGYPTEEYEAMAREMGLGESVIFTGRVDYGQVPQLLAAGDIAVSPKLSATEANGKLFNYLACGLPTVAFDTPVNREIMGDAGVYAPLGDVAALADALGALADNDERRRQLADASRRKAVEEHSWESRGARLEAIYAALLGKERG
jgi:glycosyltransferase involved in cell wall biosynthesis